MSPSDSDTDQAGNAEQEVTSVDDIEKLVTSLIMEKRTLIVYEYSSGSQMQ
jgi:hypothetical protein